MAQLKRQIRGDVIAFTKSRMPRKGAEEAQDNARRMIAAAGKDGLDESVIMAAREYTNEIKKEMDRRGVKLVTVQGIKLNGERFFADNVSAAMLDKIPATLYVEVTLDTQAGREKTASDNKVGQATKRPEVTQKTIRDSRTGKERTVTVDNRRVQMSGEGNEGRKNPNLDGINAEKNAIPATRAVRLGKLQRQIESLVLGGFITLLQARKMTADEIRALYHKHSSQLRMGERQHATRLTNDYRSSETIRRAEERSAKARAKSEEMQRRAEEQRMIEKIAAEKVREEEK